MITFTCQACSRSSGHNYLIQHSFGRTKLDLPQIKNIWSHLSAKHIQGHQGIYYWIQHSFGHTKPNWLPPDQMSYIITLHGHVDHAKAPKRAVLDLSSLPWMAHYLGKKRPRTDVLDNLHYPKWAVLDLSLLPWRVHCIRKKKPRTAVLDNLPCPKRAVLNLRLLPWWAHYIREKKPRTAALDHHHKIFCDRSI